MALYRQSHRCEAMNTRIEMLAINIRFSSGFSRHCIPIRHCKITIYYFISPDSTLGTTTALEIVPTSLETELRCRYTRVSCKQRC